ncbi:MAG: GGDEF domain-containing protein [Candidatus Saccharimonadales bacterium]
MSEEPFQPLQHNTELDDQSVIEAAHRLIGETSEGLPLATRDSYEMREAFHQSDWEQTHANDLVYETDKKNKEILDAEYRASHDPLTGLFNKQGFSESIEERINDASSGEVGVLFIDVDQFKEINDRMGHALGDAFLEKFSGWLTDHVRHDNGRQDDILYHESSIGREGGDEFAILVNLKPSREDDETARLSPSERLDILAERIMEGFDVFLQKHPSYQRIKGLGISLGGGVWEDGMTSAELLEIADKEMYFNKQRKPGRK